MLLYEFNLTYKCERYSEMESIQEDRSLWPERIAEINSLIGAHRTSLKYCFFVYRFVKNKFFMIAAANSLEPISPSDFEDALSSLLVEDYEIHSLQVHCLCEISRDKFTGIIKQCEMSHYIVEPILVRELCLDYTDSSAFTLSESLKIPGNLTYELAIRGANSMMADSSFLDELARIYSDDNDRDRFYGHPVHYKIVAGNVGAAMHMAELLVEALYANHRLSGMRINRISNITEQCYDDIDLEHLIQRAEGTTVVLELWKSNQGNLNYATGYENVVDTISDLVKKYQRNTLFVIVEVYNQQNFNSQLFDKLGSDIDFVELEEGVGNRTQALDYLKSLEKFSTQTPYDEMELKEALGAKRSFRASDIHHIHDKLYHDALKIKTYRAYRGITNYVVPKSIEKQTDAYDTLQEMVGLKQQKAMIDKIIAAFAVRKIKAKHGLGTMRMSMHMCFTGNPGSAKTTVARLLADILSKEGILTTGRFIECGRADLVGKFVGWTATQVKEKFKWARGGILFIDEAYSLVDDSRSFGDEAINTIVQEMENHRDDVVVIFAGYPKKMQEFLERNEGLRSRIAFHVDFPDYTAEELTDILRLMAKRQGYTLSQEIIDSCREKFLQVRTQKDFGNGRFVRNLLEKALTEQAHRLWTARKDKYISPADLRSLLPTDFDAAIRESTVKEETPIGFAV